MLSSSSLSSSSASDSKERIIFFFFDWYRLWSFLLELWEEICLVLSDLLALITKSSKVLIKFPYGYMFSSISPYQCGFISGRSAATDQFFPIRGSLGRSLSGSFWSESWNAFNLRKEGVEIDLWYLMPPQEKWFPKQIGTRNMNRTCRGNPKADKSRKFLQQQSKVSFPNNTFQIEIDVYLNELLFSPRSKFLESWFCCFGSYECFKILSKFTMEKQICVVNYPSKRRGWYWW